MYLNVQTYLDYGVQQLTTIERPEVTHDSTLQGIAPSWIVCLRLQTILFIKWRKTEVPTPKPECLLAPSLFKSVPIAGRDHFPLKYGIRFYTCALPTEL